MFDDKNLSIIIASPRSGTTILGKVLSLHADIAYWREPYFIWDYKLANLPDDDRTALMATDEVKRSVRHEFELFGTSQMASVIVEKTPRNSFKIPFIHEIFPNAKWIHLHRDGRDVANSILQQRMKRKNKSALQIWADLKTALNRHPLWRHRIQAVLFELRTRQRSMSYLTRNDDSWGKISGWGPRFPGWQEARAELNELQYSARQWAECEKAIGEALPLLPKENVLDVSYEELVSSPVDEMRRILSHIGVDAGEADTLSQHFDSSRRGKGSRQLSDDQIKEIIPIIEPAMKRLGYQL